MRHPVLITCLLSVLHAPVASASEALHVSSVRSLPAGVQDLLRQQHGDIADRGTQVSGGCLVEPGIVGQRLAAAEVTSQRVQVDIQHGRIHDFTRAVFALENGQWMHLATTRVPPPKALTGAFAAAFDARGGGASGFTAPAHLPDSRAPSGSSSP